MILCREENNILVPKVLDRLHLCYNQFYEEIENNQNSKPLLHLNNGQAKSDNNLIKPSPKKKSKLSYFCLIVYIWCF